MDECRFHCLNVKAYYPLDEAFIKSYVVMMVFDSILAPVAAGLNGLILVVIFKNKCLQTVPNCILVSLAVSDMIAGLLIQPMKAKVLSQILWGKVVCGLYITALQLGYLIGMTSYLSLTLLAFERYVAIFHPFKYHELTARRGIVFWPILGIWIFSVLVAFSSFLTPQMTIMRLFVIVLIPVVILWSSFVHIRACLLVKRINTQTPTVTGSTVNKDAENAGNQVSFTGTHVSGIGQETVLNGQITNANEAGGNCITALSIEQHRKEAAKHRSKKPSTTIKRQRTNLKATRLAFLILVVLLLCYIPSCVLSVLRDYAGVDSRLVHGIHDWGTSFVLLNSTLNPLIYCWQLSEMRIKIIALFKSMSCRRKHAT